MRGMIMTHVCVLLKCQAMKKYLIYIPLVIILIIQFFDKNDDLILLQYVFLVIMVIAVVLKLAKRKS